jgi:hypothetical protein
MYILANLAVGGNWPGDPDSHTPMPAHMDIDYIRAYSNDPNAHEVPLQADAAAPAPVDPTPVAPPPPPVAAAPVAPVVDPHAADAATVPPPPAVALYVDPTMWYSGGA